MALTYSEMVPLGKRAPEFALRGIDGNLYKSSDFYGKKALVVMFICKHCPYVAAVQGRIAKIAKDYAEKGIQFVGICSNDAKAYPEDSIEHLRIQAKEVGFTFPYLIDETQETAKSYGAVATPDIFVFDQALTLRYRGRIDDSWKDESRVSKRDLEEALNAILEHREVSSHQYPSMGCSIKWKFN